MCRKQDGAGCGAKKCRHQEITIDAWPEVLAVQLKRFKHNQSTGRLNKISTHVTYENYLRVNQGPEYKLRALLMHYGSFGTGHYTSYVRFQDDAWHYCDDSAKPRLCRDSAEVFKQQVYMLFYERGTEVAEIAA